MQDDQGKWWEYVLKNMDIDVDIPFTGGELKLPSGGSWRAATKAEEEEIDKEKIIKAIKEIDDECRRR